MHELLGFTNSNSDTDPMLLLTSEDAELTVAARV